jgi:hypothetical protein
MSVLSFHPAYLIAILFDIGFDVLLQFLAAVWWDYESYPAPIANSGKQPPITARLWLMDFINVSFQYPSRPYPTATTSSQNLALAGNIL